MVRDTPKKYDVFLSYSHLDAPSVEELGGLLTDRFSFEVWLDRWRLIPGDNWQQRIAEALKEAQTCAVCIGAQTPKGWFREEIQRALNLQTRDGSFRVIPVLLPGANKQLVDDFLELRTWVIFEKSLDEERALHLLSSGIRGISPGRFYTQDSSQEFILLKERLARLRELRQDNLIDDDVAIDFQKRILERI